MKLNRIFNGADTYGGPVLLDQLIKSGINRGRFPEPVGPVRRISPFGRVTRLLKSLQGFRLEAEHAQIKRAIAWVKNSNDDFSPRTVGNTEMRSSTPPISAEAGAWPS